MAIDRFQNTDILVSTKVPIDNVHYSLSDAANLSSIDYQLESFNYGTNTLVETYIFFFDKLVNSADSTILYELNTSDDNIKTDILIKPERDARLSNVESGYYSLVYNFVKPSTPPLKVRRIVGR